jgi:predicted nucleic acid-binding protein
VQSILVDAGPLVALFRANDSYHECSKAFVGGNARPLVTTWPVLTEVCFFLNAHGKSRLLTWVQRGGLRLHPIAENDLPVIQTLIDKYGDRIDLADASLVWLGTKLKIKDIITIDRDDFSVYRGIDGKPFRNLLKLS